MWSSMVIFCVLAAGLLFYGWMRGGGEHVAGLRIAWKMGLEVLPLLIAAFVVAGMVQALIPQETVARWVGGGSGWRGILLGSFAGSLTPGGPFVSLPIAAGFMRAGADTGVMVAYLTGWSLWGINRLPMEVGILGWRLTLIRLASCLVLPPVAGYTAKMITRLL